MSDYTELRAALAAGPTDGPWRWEFSAENKVLHLVGGCPKFDLSIMDFVRWGMGGAGVRLRDLSPDSMNLMHKLHDRPDWIAPFPGREHHKHWCANVVHPDMRMIAAANPATVRRLLEERDALADIPEGCTSADAKVLREANHRLADENSVMREAAQRVTDAFRALGITTRLDAGFVRARRECEDAVAALDAALAPSPDGGV